MDVYVETGRRRSFAGAVEWPGWCRRGRDEDEALQALLAHGDRYARVLRGTRLGFAPPRDPFALRVVERVRGTATTDFGAPDVAPSIDARSLDASEVRRLGRILRACWRAFDGAVEEARGVRLSTGPRGGGRNVSAIVGHVVDAEAAYLRLIGWKVPEGPASGALERGRTAALDGFETTARDGVRPSPRGGKRWCPRFFVRRAAWHVLDHAWEIEDRIA